MAESHAAPVEVKIEDFASLVSGMSRLLTGVARLPAFTDAELGLAEWSALMVLASKDGINNKQLAKSLGITGQRVNQITKSLTTAGLIAVSQSTDDSRKNVIAITDAGKAQLTAVNSKLLPAISASLEKRERSLQGANRNIKALMGLVAVKSGNSAQREAAAEA